MSSIVIVGGHGKIALQLAQILSDSGHSVTSLIRNPDHGSEVTANGASPRVADVEHLSTNELADVFSGHDAVVFSAGAGGGPAERTYAVDRDAAIRTMDAATAAKVQRYVMVSYFGAGPGHGVDPSNSFYAYAESKAAADEYLKNTDLEWTIVAPSSLTLDPATGQIELGPEVKPSSVSRADVAAVIAAVLAAPRTIGAVIPFNNGPTPIASAIEAIPSRVE